VITIVLGSLLALSIAGNAVTFFLLLRQNEKIFRLAMVDQENRANWHLKFSQPTSTTTTTSLPPNADDSSDSTWNRRERGTA